MSNLRFDDKVVIVTGAGNGLGRQYALEFGKRGAKVVVNDLGGSLKGEATTAAARPADVVVNEIKAAGGQAVANYDSVEFGDKIVKTAVDAFGTIDIVVNNAGILRDISLTKMTELDWDLIMKVHLKGSYSVAKAAWPIMMAKKYGRIVNTSSSSGVFGSFGQANYAAAKLGLHGFTQTLAKEGASKNIKTNTIIPTAGTRMTETVWSKELMDAFNPAAVAPVVLYLCHDSCEENGSLIEAGGGAVGKYRFERTQGSIFFLDEMTPEKIRDNWNTITDFSSKTWHPTSAQEAITPVLQHLTANKDRKKGPESAKTAAADGLKAHEIFGMMQQYLSDGHGKDLVPKVAAVFGFDILKAKGDAKPTASFTINLKDGNGHVKAEAPSKFDANFTMTDEDFHKVCMGTLNPQMAFIQGQMKIKGNMGKATKFTPELFPPPTPENIAKFGPKPKL